MTNPVIPHPHDTAILQINTDALADNIHLLQDKAAPARVAGVVKADGYGLGLAQVARAHLRCGTDFFFVATPDEGAALRELCGKSVKIAVLGGLPPGAADFYIAHDLMPVLNTPGQVEQWRTDRCHGCPAVLHIDTGMRRLGFDTQETQALIDDPDRLRGVNIAVLMSHFACADEPGHTLTREQYARFCEVAALFPGALKSLSNSAGLFADPGYHFDLVRPGMAVYGLNPVSGDNPMRPVVQLSVRVLQLRKALKGESVGYGATWTAPTDRRIATVALGYADGFLRSLSGKGTLFHRGRALPIVGRVSMDLVTLDVSAAPDLKEGDWVDVLGPDQDADRLAADAGTIGYEILTGLGARYRRVYEGAA